MKKKHLLLVVIALLISLVTVAVQGNSNQNREITKNYSLQNYTDSIILALESQNEKIQNRVFSSNFEGPKISIEYLVHHNKVWDTEQLPGFSFTPQHINFDPDWQSYGLPNLHIELTQPKFINAFQQEELMRNNFKHLKNYFNFSTPNSPIRSYSKTFKNSEGQLVKEHFDLYLTEFHITIGIKPLRELPVLPLNSSDKTKRRYPKYWYHFTDSTQNQLISLEDLKRKKENKNQRYSRLQCIFKIEPNNQAWYIDPSLGNQETADVAIGEIITRNITSNFKKDSGYQQAHLVPSAPGLNLDLFLNRTLKNRYAVEQVSSENKTSNDPTIFNKPVYFRIESNNIGSWDKKGIFFGTEWDDQFTLTFLMPILVKGKFDVLLDADIKPNYIPQDAYYNSVKLNDVLPKIGINGFGKYISKAFIVFIILIAILFTPQVFNLINAIFKRLTHKIKTPPNS